MAPPEKRADGQRQLARLRRQLAQIVDIDFFGANGRQAAEAALSAIEARLAEAGLDLSRETAMSGDEALDGLQGRTWVTREGVHVEWIASAWLVRRFIDPKASFKFVLSKGYRP